MGTKFVWRDLNLSLAIASYTSYLHSALLTPELSNAFVPPKLVHPLKVGIYIFELAGLGLGIEYILGVLNRFVLPHNEHVNVVASYLLNLLKKAEQYEQRGILSACKTDVSGKIEGLGNGV